MSRSAIKNFGKKTLRLASDVADRPSLMLLQRGNHESP